LDPAACAQAEDRIVKPLPPPKSFEDIHRICARRMALFDKLPRPVRDRMNADGFLDHAEVAKFSRTSRDIYRKIRETYGIFEPPKFS
jgi:hypothetical protein